MRGTAALGLALAVLTVAPLVGSLVEFFDTGPWGEEVQLAAGAEVEGDPASDERAATRVEAGGESGTVVLKRTPAGLLDEVPWAEQAREASPLGPVDARLRLAAGPVVLEEVGEVSPRFPLQAHVSVDRTDDVDRTWLRLGGERWAPLEKAGETQAREVWLGRLAPGTLAAGETTRVDVVFERRLGPEVRQLVHGPSWHVHADARGPPQPNMTLADGQVQLAGEGERFEAQARPAGGAWQAVRVDEATVSVPDGLREVRARGIDEVGNPGPWTRPVSLNASEPEPADEQLFVLVAPEDGARLEGETAVDWKGASGPVEVRVRPGPSAAWQHVGRADEPPIRWRTGFVPDGNWQVHVRAQHEGSWTSRLVTVTVDNLAEPSLARDGETGEKATATPAIEPRTRSPLSAALASGAGLLALSGLVGRAWKRRPK